MYHLFFPYNYKCIPDAILQYDNFKLFVMSLTEEKKYQSSTFYINCLKFSFWMKRRPLGSDTAKEKKKFLTFLGESDLNLSSELSSCSVDSEYLGLSPGSQKPDVHGKVYDNHILTTFSPHSLSPSRGGLFWIYLCPWFLCWFGADFKAPSFPQPKKGFSGIFRLQSRKSSVPE